MAPANAGHIACPWFDAETSRILQQINDAWKSKAELCEYGRLRDEIARRHHNVNLQMQTLTIVVRLAQQQQQQHGGDDQEQHQDPEAKAEEAAAWQDFFACANDSLADTASPAADAAAAARLSSSSSSPPPPPSRPRNYNHITRARNLAVVVALWSYDVVHHYGWAHVGQAQLKLLRAAAERFPDFNADLAPRLNALLLTRHCQAILHGRERSLNEAALQPFSDLDVHRLAATSSIDADWEREWLTDASGSARLAPPDADASPALLLRQARPHHFHLYHLAKDRFGILVSRPQRDDNRGGDSDDGPQIASPVVPPCSISAAAAAAPVAADDDHDWFDAMIQLPASPVQNAAPDTRMATCAPENPRLLQCRPQDSPPNRVRDPNATMLSTPRSQASDEYNLWSPPPAIDGDDSQSPSAMLQGTWPGLGSPLTSIEFTHISSARSSTEPSQPSSLPRTPLHAFDLSLTATAVAGKENAPKSSALKRAGRTKRTRPRLQRPTSPRGDGDDAMDTEDSTHYATSTACKSRRCDPVRHDSPQMHSLAYYEPLFVSSPSGGALPLSPGLEHNLHHRHGPDVVKYIKQLRVCEQGGQRAMHSQWLTPNTTWAKAWSSSTQIGTGWATCADEADVLYYTSEDMVSAAESGTIFRKPTVVKERFTDHGMHNVAGFLSLVEASSSRPSLRVRALDKKLPTAIDMEKLADIARAPSQSTSLGVHALNLGNRTHCHRPLFTMLSRFRLLDTLTEEFHGPDRDGHGKSLLSNDIDARVGFNLLALSGAFMGANVNSLCGCWMRNLHGLVYYTIVPESEMASEWNNFAKEGDDWLPCGRERLIVLEQDDVLFLPPGVRIVHASHSPGSCLMEGGVLWDTLNLPEILTSLSWSLSNPLTIVKEAFSFPIPRILDNLRQLVQSQPDKFRGAHDDMHFLDEVESMIDALLDRHAESLH